MSGEAYAPLMVVIFRFKPRLKQNVSRGFLLPKKGRIKKLKMERGEKVMESILHARFDGRSFDIPLSKLDIGSGSNDGEVKAALAWYLDVAESRFRDYVVERHDNGNFTVRPEAVFG
jgi:hypothetical protein